MSDTFEDLDPQEMYELLPIDRQCKIERSFFKDTIDEDELQAIVFAFKDGACIQEDMRESLQDRWTKHIEFLFRPLKSDWQAALTAYNERQLQLAEDAHDDQGT